MNEEILSRLGFTSGEIKVFLSLLKLGNVTTGPIVDASGVSKSKVYEILERLTKKGVVSQTIENNTKQFQAINPKQLLNLYDNKEQELKDLKKDLLNIMPDLELQYNSNNDKQEVTVFRGEKGLKTIFEDMIDTLDKDEELIVFVAVPHHKYFDGYLKGWSKRSIEKGIKLKIIANDDVTVFREKMNQNDKLTEIKTLSKEFNTPAVFNLYKNKTAILLWSENPIGILIENNEITMSFKQYFNILWGIAK